jgi:hypothetical protein
MAPGAIQGHEIVAGSGEVSCFPRSQNRDLGHPGSCGSMDFQGRFLRFTAHSVGMTVLRGTRFPENSGIGVESAPIEKLQFIGSDHSQIHAL